MTVARSAGDVLSDHTVFEVECIDRMFLNVYVPQLLLLTDMDRPAKRPRPLW